MTYHRVCNYINTTNVTSGAETAYSPGAHEFTPVFSGVRGTRSLVLYVCFVVRCLSFCNFSLAIVLSVLRNTDSDCPFGISKLFLRRLVIYTCRKWELKIQFECIQSFQLTISFLEKNRIYPIVCA